jgi:hypothetical protein
MRLTLTDFIDFVAKSGTPKMTHARNVKRRGEYDPATDYYLPIRSRIIEACSRGRPVSAASLTAGCHPKKRSHYAQIASGFERWQKLGVGRWLAPPVAEWTCGDVRVRINPELALKRPNELLIVKLYFKAEPLSRARIDLITHLMERALRRESPPGSRMGVLDIRKARLWTPPTASSGLDAQLVGEAAYLEAVWDSL